MTDFIYKARNREGRLIEGDSEADDAQAVIADLQQRGFIVLSVNQATRSQGAKITKSNKAATSKKHFHTKAKYDDIIVFGQQLAALIDAGIPLLKTLDMMLGLIDSKKLYDAVSDIRDKVSQGSQLYKAIERHPKIFIKMWVYMIETGESSGQLPQALKEVLKYLETAEGIKRKVVSALTYPALLFTVAGGAMGFFILFIVPIFSNIFKQFDAKLPAMSQMVVTMSYVGKRYAPVVFIIIVAAIFGIRWYLNTPLGRRQRDGVMLNLPIFGLLIRRMTAARFARTLSTLTKSGVPIIQALNISAETAGNIFIEEMLRDAANTVKVGGQMSAALHSHNIFPDMVPQMINVAEEAGNLGFMLDRVTAFYEERVNATVERMTVLFEPIMLVFMGGVVGFLVVSMFLPILTMGLAVK